MSAARRYAISGRDHTGKSTICHAVTARLRAQGVDAEMVDEQSRRSVALAEGRRGVSTQMDLFARTVVVESRWPAPARSWCATGRWSTSSPTPTCCPRTPTRRTCAMRRAMDAFAEHYLATYAAIFLPAWTLETVEEDPLRAPVRHLQDDLAAHIERRLAPYAELVVRLDAQATAVDAVVAHILGDLSGQRGL